MLLAGPEDLPNELVCAICLYLQAVEVVHLLTTCKTLHAFMAEETIWKQLCALYGLRDPADLNGTTFFEVYSRLLHAYGPLIGLWASDAPYMGRIVEFRLDAENKAIIGEEWWMRDLPILGQSPPVLPTYTALVSIFLSDEESVPTSTRYSGGIGFRWRSEVHDYDRGVVYYDLLHSPERAGTLTPSLTRLSPCEASTYVTDFESYSLLPDFPRTGSLGHAWYAATRDLPRLPLEPSPVAHTNSPADAMTWLKRNERFPCDLALFTAKSEYVKPAALCIQSRALDRLASNPFLIRPALRMERSLNENTQPSPSGVDFSAERFYPLRSEYRIGHDPADELWHPSCLEGLWLGDYGTLGTEVLWLSHDDSENLVRAVKVTGDHNVPRGTVSWSIDINKRMDAAEQAQQAWYEGTPSQRMYQGMGTVSTFGFRDAHRDSLQVAAVITGPDEIRTYWVGLLETDVIARYRRYPRRDVEAEEEIRRCCRRAVVNPT